MSQRFFSFRKKKDQRLSDIEFNQIQNNNYNTDNFLIHIPGLIPLLLLYGESGLEILTQQVTNYLLLQRSSSAVRVSFVA